MCLECRLRVMIEAPNGLLTVEGALGSCPVVIMMMYAAPVSLMWRHLKLFYHMARCTSHEFGILGHHICKYN